MRPESIQRRLLTLENYPQPAVVYEGGEGPALLLIHGAWGDASLHWSRAWARLSENHHVIAPELPGFSPGDDRPCASVAEYVRWLVALLDALGVERATPVGNSLGAAVAWSFAGRAQDRSAGVILVNGAPMPSTPAPLAWMAGTKLGERLMRTMLRRLLLDPSGADRAFHGDAPERARLRSNVLERRALLLDTLTPVMIEGDGPPDPSTPPLLLWGADDRLPRCTANDARALAEKLDGARLELVDAAGHFPQLEAPDRFTEAVERYVARLSSTG